MQIRLSLLFFIVLSIISISGNEAFSQSLRDSIPVEKPKGEMLLVSSPAYDSTQLKYQNTVKPQNSIQVGEQSRWVEKSNQRLDSIQNIFNQRADSLMSAYKHKIDILNSLKSVLRNELDSLAKNNISGNRITDKLDSVTKLHGNITAQFETKLQNIKGQASSKITKLNLPPEVAERARAITGNINNLKIPSSNARIPALDGFNSPLVKLEDLGNVGEMNGLNTSGITDQVGMVDIPQGLGNSGQLTNATGKIPDVSNVSDKLNGFPNNAGSLPKGDINAVENLSKVAEEKVAEVSGISEIEKQTQTLDQYKEMATNPPSQDSLKELALQQITQVAVNHFAGKEQVIQEAMETMTKYKNKYSNVTSIADLPKKRPNEMRGKPFIERIIPGIALQIQKEGDDLMVDFNAYFAYRFTAKINAGAGWNQRVAYNTKYNGLNSAPRVYGPRLFGEYNLWKGFSPRAELEVMNTNVPAITTTDPLEREWVWGAFIGVKKEYRIIRNIKGTAMIMTRLFNPDHKSPYADVLNVRFGFEFPMKKKVEKKN